MNAHTPIRHLRPAWETFHKVTEVAPIRDEEHHQRMRGGARSPVHSRLLLKGVRDV